MAFKPLRYDDGKMCKQEASSGLTVSKWDALTTDGSGQMAGATSGATEINLVAMEDVSSATAGDEFLCLHVDGIEFEADTEDNMAQSYVGTKVEMGADDGELDASATGENVFRITKMVGATTDKKCRGFFVQEQT